MFFSAHGAPFYLNSLPTQTRSLNRVFLALVVAGFSIAQSAVAETAGTSASADPQTTQATSQTTLKVGILATEGATRAIEAWGPTIEALNQATRDQGQPYEFQLEPHTRASMLQGVERGDVDIVLSDSALFVALEVDHGARPALSTAHIWEGQTVEQTGALIFARRDRAIRTIAHLKGMRVMAVAANGFPGRWLADQEFHRRRLDPGSHLSSLVFSGGNEREVVYAVQSGLVDAGIVRTGLLENLARQGVVNMEEFAPVSPRQHDDFPFWSSTLLYPDRVLSALPDVPEDALGAMINALLAIKPNDAVSATAGGAVWQAPQNYQSVHNLLIQLRAPPYEKYYVKAASRILSTYRWPVIGMSLLVILSIAFLCLQLWKNMRLAEERRDILKSEVRSKKFYRNAVEEHTVFCMLTREGIISHVNDRFLDIVSGKRSALVNTPLADLLGDQERDTVLKDITTALKQGAPWRGSLCLNIHKDKATWVQCTFIPVNSASETLSEVALVATDVTTIRTGVSEKRFQNTLELMQDQVIVMRPGTFDVLYCNTAAINNLSLNRMGGVWQGKRAADFITPEDFQLLKARCEAIELGPQRRIIWEADSKVGKTFEISLEYCLPEHDEPRIVAMYRDISERKVAERAKNDFIATVSHELRTPLTSMKGALSLAASGAVGEMPEKVEKLVKLANSNCERLHLLIDDILDLEKIESGNMDFNLGPCDLRQMISEATDENMHYANQFGVTISHQFASDDEDYITYGDQGRLRQVMDNLMSNAAKFSPPGGEVLVTVKRHRGRLRIAVRDYGPGIPKAAQPTIFDKFTQADTSDTRSKGGTGLGLAIARQIVDHHKGSLFFVSEDGAGTEFFCDLPILEGETILDVPVGADDGSEDDERFSQSVPKDLVETYVEPDEQEFSRLVKLVNDNGEGIRTENGRVNIVQIAKGAGALGPSRVPTWLTPQQRSFLADLLNQGLSDNRAASIIEFAPKEEDGDPSKGAQPDLLDTALGWLSDGLATTGLNDGKSLKGIVVATGMTDRVSGNADLRVVAEPSLARAIAKSEQKDFIAWIGRVQDADTVTLFPMKGGRLSEGMPLTIVVSNPDANLTEPGVVSKFPVAASAPNSGATGGERGRARSRLG